MNKEQKTATIAELKDKFSSSSFFYITDASTLTVAQINKLRRMCFQKGVEMKVLKNTLVKKALEDAPTEKGYGSIFQLLNGPSTILFSDAAKTPAEIIEAFRKGGERPILKGAYIDSDVYVGDDQLSTIMRLKSREELIAEVILMLESPAQGVIGALGSGAQTIFRLLETIEKKGAE